VGHHLQGISDGTVRRNCDRINDHPALGSLHLIHLGGLRFNRKITMNHPDASLLRDGDGQMRLGDRVHRRAGDGNIQPHMARKIRRRVRLRRQDIAFGGNQEDIIKSDGFRKIRCRHSACATSD
jgi:hypothetical protein